MNEEDYCLYAIQAIQRRAQEDMKPYIDRLVRIHSMQATVRIVDIAKDHPLVGLHTTGGWTIVPEEKPADVSISGQCSQAAGLPPA